MGGAWVLLSILALFEGACQQLAMADQYPPALRRAMDAIWDNPHERHSWALYSDEYYWDYLLRKEPFRSCYAEDGGEQPLIDYITVNLSQTCREEAELNGLAPEGPHTNPGAEVQLHSLQSAAHLNGQIGRVLPRTGRGAPDRPPDPSRIPVRLRSGQVVACKPQNIQPTYQQTNTDGVCELSEALAGTSISSAGASSAAAGGSGAAGAATAAAAPSGRLAELIRASVHDGFIPPVMTKETLVRFGMPQPRCNACRRTDCNEYVALARTQSLSSNPNPNMVKLKCVDCLIRKAERLGVEADEETVEDWVDIQIMGSMEVYAILQGQLNVVWGGQHGEGQMY